MLSSHLRWWTTYGRGALKAALACFVATCCVGDLSAAAPPAVRPGIRLVRVIKVCPGPVFSIDFSPNGKVLATVGDDTLRLWDPFTGKKLRGSNSEHDLISFAYFAQGGRTLVCSGGGALTEVDLVDGRSLKRRARIRLAEGARSVAVSPDGALLGIGQWKKVSLWDVATGKPRGVVRLTPTTSHSEFPNNLSFAPDVRTLVAELGEPFARVCDVEAAKEVRRSQPRELPADFRMQYLAFLPGSKILVATSFWYSSIYLWDVDRRILLREIRWKTPVLSREEMAEGRKQPRKGLYALALSPDGKTIAGACHDGKLRLWEVATGRVRRQTLIQGSKMAFAPTGSLLAMITFDKASRLRGTVHLWDWRSPGPRPPKRLSGQALENLWSKLAKEDAGGAYLASAALAALPRQATALLGKRLRRVEPVAAKELARLVASLDEDDFDARQRAFQKLLALGRVSSAKLQVAAERGRTLEMRKLAKELIRRMQPITPEQLRVLRCVEVLEYVGTAEARRVLARLASGAAGALETEDAKRALKRLKMLGASTP
jgi:WD40 repeat protein